MEILHVLMGDSPLIHNISSKSLTYIESGTEHGAIILQPVLFNFHNNIIIPIDL
jgi:hypothetical protein